MIEQPFASRDDKPKCPEAEKIRKVWYSISPTVILTVNTQDIDWRDESGLASIQAARNEAYEKAYSTLRDHYSYCPICRKVWEGVDHG